MPVDDPEGDDATQQRPWPHTVLHIEDNVANRRLIERIFERRPSIEVITATEGLVGIDVARVRQPSVVLLDVDLPDVSGAVVLKCLRADPTTAAIPVVVVTADADYRQIQRFLETGAVAYFTKPIDVRRLLDMIDELIDEQPPRPRASIEMDAKSSLIRIVASDLAWETRPGVERVPDHARIVERLGWLRVELEALSIEDARLQFIETLRGLHVAGLPLAATERMTGIARRFAASPEDRSLTDLLLGVAHVLGDEMDAG
jgi:CheY-like chemotaxis protein